MFAYILDNELSFISSEKLTEEFLPNISDYEILEYSDEIKNPIFENGKIIEAEVSESPEEKRQRKFAEFAEADEEELENFDWEGVEITEQDYNHLIVLRDFNGDHGSQIALLMKAFIKLLAILVQKPELKPIILQAFSDELELVTHLSESRKALGLNGIELPEQLLK